MESFVGLLNNSALLLALGVVYDILGLESIEPRPLREVLSGSLIGLLGITVMLTPWYLEPGVFFDTRWVLLSVGALFFGIYPTLVAVLMTVAFRLFQGGAGAYVGSLVIVSTAATGLLWRHYESARNWTLSWWNLYLFGLLVQLVMLTCVFFMPAELRFRILAAIAPPVLLIYPVVTTLLGLMLRRQRDRRHLALEQEKLQTQLLQAQKMEMVGNLAGGIAHDFNNMLAVILGQAEMAKLRMDNRPRLEAALAEIKSAAQRSSALTSQLLAFARKQAVAPKVIDLNENVDGMLTMLGRLLGEEIELILKKGENLWPIEIDPGQLDQVLTNLCINARDAIDGHGRLMIETAHAMIDEDWCRTHCNLDPGEYVVLRVSDTGRGMDAEVRKRVFEPFFTTKESGRGKGLGLATVYGIVKQNRGYIGVYSEPGHGSTFQIYLPRSRKGDLWQEASGIDAIPRGQESVLLIEDEESVLTLTRDMLESFGYRVLTATNVNQVLKRVEEQSEPVDLLLSDVVMPGMNGREVAQMLIPKCPNLRVLFMSGYPADVIGQQGMLEEGVTFISKPFTRQELATKVREALAVRAPATS